MVRWPLLLGLTALPAAAQPQDIDYGSIDGFLVPQAHARWTASMPLDEGGQGLGVRVLSRATERLMVLGEYQYVEYGGAGTGQYRIGAGWTLPSTSGVFLTYDYLDLHAEDGFGFGLHGRVAGTVAEPLSLYAQAGYVTTRGSSFYFDGFEFTLGMSYDLAEPWGLFADYRATLLDDRDSVERLHREALRVGVRFRFDC